MFLSAASTAARKIEMDLFKTRDDVDEYNDLVAEVQRLRALLHEAYHELHTIDAFTVTPTPPDEFFNLVRRIKEELEEG
jgi:hypothetical protein